MKFLNAVVLVYDSIKLDSYDLHKWLINILETEVYLRELTRHAYSFKLNESILILPQSGFYYGLKGEFQEFLKGTKSIRNFIGVGIKMTLNRN